MKPSDAVIADALAGFTVELPSWGFVGAGTRFGVYPQPAAAVTLEEKFSDAAEVHRFTGICPSLALHAGWDLPGCMTDVKRVQALVRRTGVRAGSLSPTLFQEPRFKFGSLANPDPALRREALGCIHECVAVAQALGSRDLSLWLADGSNYPGAQNMRDRIAWIEGGLRDVHARLAPGQRLLIEYKPFEPAFYHTDIGDWGMALLLAQHAGPQARVLVDTGHHFPGQNIEQIVAWLLHHGRLGGFHLNDRRYADDDLTVGSIDPYQLFRIFAEIHSAARSGAKTDELSFILDQSHAVKLPIEAMLQSVCTAQEMYLKAALVDYDRLAELQRSCATIDAEECLREAFWFDVRPVLREWRRGRGWPEAPLRALRESGYVERITAERADGRGLSPKSRTAGGSR